MEIRRHEKSVHKKIKTKKAGASPAKKLRTGDQ